MIDHVLVISHLEENLCDFYILDIIFVEGKGHSKDAQEAQLGDTPSDSQPTGSAVQNKAYDAGATYLGCSQAS